MRSAFTKIIFTALVSLSVSTLLQDSAMANDTHPERPNLQQGKIFAVELSPTNDSLKIKVNFVGKKIAETELSKASLTVLLGEGATSVSLKPVRQGDHFIAAKPQISSPTKLEISVERGNDKEKFEFKLQPQN